MPPFLSPLYQEEVVGRDPGISLQEMYRLITYFQKLADSLSTLSQLVGSHQELRSKHAGSMAAMIRNLRLADPSAAERAQRELSSLP
jgi:hypothetical protein